MHYSTENKILTNGCLSFQDFLTNPESLWNVVEYDCQEWGEKGAYVKYYRNKSELNIEFDPFIIKKITTDTGILYTFEVVFEDMMTQVSQVDFVLHYLVYALEWGLTIGVK